MISARVLADSVSTVGVRLTTLEVTMPRIVLAEFNTHRMFSRNSASSRAIPVEKMIKRVEEDPFTPVYWGKNQRGMQAEQELDDADRLTALSAWWHARDDAVKGAERLLALGVHKQIANRLLEPFMWHTVIVTATEWSNFFHLRDNKDAQPEIQGVAVAMGLAMKDSTPTVLSTGDWHLPLIFDDERALPAYTLATVSAARCARVSYLTHDTGKRDVEADKSLYGKLLDGGHMSPLEHPAQACADTLFKGNLRGWASLRHQTSGESDILGWRLEREPATT